jgi:hypothetical protein
MKLRRKIFMIGIENDTKILKKTLKIHSDLY